MSAWYEVEIYDHDAQDWRPMFAHKREDGAEQRRVCVWRSGLDVRVVKVTKNGKRRVLP